MAGSVSITIQNLELLIQQEGELFRKIETEIAHIMEQLNNIKAVLKEMKEADEEKEMVGLLQELRLIAFRTEDHLEEFVFRCRTELGVGAYGACGFMHTVKHLLSRVKEQRNVANRIKVIEGRLRDSKTKMHESISAATARTSPTEDDSLHMALFVQEAQLVGIDEPKEQLIRWLVEEPDPNVGVVSVFGMGGLGKTTLVKKVYDNGTVRAHFHIHCWATMSQTYSEKHLLEKLILSTLLQGENTGTLDSLAMDKEAHQLKETLINRLQGKRYFIVIDDTWNLDAWEGIKSALPDSKCGSRIIVTTRSRNVANALVENSGYAYELKLLSPEDSWRLFHKVAFRSDGVNDDSADEHLREVILKFLHKCGGLPLAIVSLAEFLYTKERSEWDAILRNNEPLFHHSTPLRSVFYSSYNGLPKPLKSCLLYWCLFPEDYVIKCSRLLRLWAAEGFSDPLTSSDTTLTKEDVAKRYLDELIGRSLIQMQDIDVYGRVRTCRIHNVFREFVLTKARGQDFAEFWSDGETNNYNTRRLSTFDKHVDRNIFPKRTRFLSQIQSFFAYGESSFNSSAVSTFLSGGVKLLKVLDLEGTHLTEFPGEVLTNLYFLRYLGINSKTFSLPSSLGRLINLETLVLKGPLLFQLPNDILQLKCLRNLLGDFLELPKGIGGMTTLEKLNLVVGHDGIDEELGMLTRLRSLCIVCVIKEDKNSAKIFALSSIEKMEYLRTLYLRLSKPKVNYLDVQNLRHFPPLLRSLTLVGAMNGVPIQILSLENLTQLKLSYSGVQDDAFFEDLQLLPELVELELEMDAMDVAELHFRKGKFLKLRTLELHGLSKLKLIVVEEGAMPCIQNIRFINCQLVEKVPVGIEHLTTLKQIGLAMMASNLEGELKSHHWKAGHSPSVQSFADEFKMGSYPVRAFIDELDAAD